MKRKLLRTLVAAVVISTCTPAPAQEKRTSDKSGGGNAMPEKAAPSADKKPTVSYKLQFTLNELENHKKINTRSYTMVLQEDRKGVFRVGSRVPVATGSFTPGGSSGTALTNTQYQYLDVGFNLDCKISGPEDNLTLDSTVDVSSFSVPPQSVEQRSVNNPVIRQARTNVTSNIVPGKPTIIATLDEMDTPRSLQIEVTATRLR